MTVVGVIGAMASTRSWRRGASYERASKCVFMDTHGNLAMRQLPLRDADFSIYASRSVVAVAFNSK